MARTRLGICVSTDYRAVGGGRLAGCWVCGVYAWIAGAGEVGGAVVDGVGV